MKKLGLILLILAVFMSGCIVSTSDSQTKTSGKSSSSGFSVDFADNAPFSKIAEGQEVAIKIEIVHSGDAEIDLGEVQARLTGEVRSDSAHYNPSNSGIVVNREYLPSAQAEDTTITLELDLGTIRYKPDNALVADKDAEVKAEVCVPYSTKSFANNFLISDDLEKRKSLTVKNSAAPVKISNLELEPGFDEVIFSFDVTKSKGDFVRTCFDDTEEEDDDADLIDVDIVNPAGVSCESLGGGSSGTLEMASNKRTVRCSVPSLEEGDSESQLIINLDYNYNIEVSKEITIRPRER